MTQSMNLLHEINDLARSDAQGLIEISEQRYAAQLDSVASRVTSTPESTVVMLAGPSGSGKTTTAKKLCERFRTRGCGAYLISLDDFYLGVNKAPRREDGTRDFETVHALDLPLFTSTIRRLILEGESDIPQFDFTKGSRSEHSMHLKLERGDVVVIEGLHALNPLITCELPAGSLFKLYVSLSTRIYDDDGNVVLSKRDMRLSRRLVRDFKYRGSDAQETFDIWQSVVKGEDEYLFPYENLAFARLNSFHPCEPCVLKSEAIRVLEQLEPSSQWYAVGSELIKKWSRFVDIPVQQLPDTSLLREFAGDLSPSK